MRCNSCQNCRDLELVKKRVLACANQPFSHADDGKDRAERRKVRAQRRKVKKKVKNVA